MLTEESRGKLLDKIAALVDENYDGRSEMCEQFADLLHRALTHLQFPSRGVVGTAIYFDHQGNEIFRWQHAWVRVGEEAIDGNVDCLSENPLVSKQVGVSPHLGANRRDAKRPALARESRRRPAGRRRCRWNLVA